MSLSEAPVPPCSAGQDSETTKVRLIFMGELKKWCGKAEISVELPPGSTVDSLARNLSRICGEEFGRRVLTQDGAFQPHVAVFINGIHAGRLNGGRTLLSGGEVELMLLPVYEGG